MEEAVAWKRKSSGGHKRCSRKLLLLASRECFGFIEFLALVLKVFGFGPRRI